MKNFNNCLINYDSTLICLQETFFQDTNQLNIRNYKQYSYMHKDGCRASKGVFILIRKDLPLYQLNIDSELQVIVFKANIYSIYITPHDLINESKLNWLIEQIPKPHMLLGDLYSHNTLCGGGE